MTTADLSTSEFNYFYATYLNTLSETDDLLTALEEGKEWFKNFITKLENGQLRHSYEDGKWTVAEVLVHLIDTERIFQYRAFRFSRNDMTPLPGFEQDGYIFESRSNERTKASIVSEYIAVRESTQNLFQNLTGEQLKRTGTASGMPWSVAALGLVISGHQKHHVHILQQRYLLG